MTITTGSAASSDPTVAEPVDQPFQPVLYERERSIHIDAPPVAILTFLEPEGSRAWNRPKPNEHRQVIFRGRDGSLTGYMSRVLTDHTDVTVSWICTGLSSQGNQMVTNFIEGQHGGLRGADRFHG